MIEIMDYYSEDVKFFTNPQLQNSTPSTNRRKQNMKTTLIVKHPQSQIPPKHSKSSRKQNLKDNLLPLTEEDSQFQPTKPPTEIISPSVPLYQIDLQQMQSEIKLGDAQAQKFIRRVKRAKSSKDFHSRREDRLILSESLVAEKNLIIQELQMQLQKERELNKELSSSVVYYASRASNLINSSPCSSTIDSSPCSSDLLSDLEQTDYDFANLMGAVESSDPLFSSFS